MYSRCVNHCVKLIVIGVQQVREIESGWVVFLMAELLGLDVVKDELLGLDVVMGFEDVLVVTHELNSQLCKC